MKIRIILTIAFIMCVCIGRSFGKSNDANAIRIMTYNIHWGEGRDKIHNIERIAQVIRESNADIIGLQEVDNHFSHRSEFINQAAELGRILNMNYFHCPSVPRKHLRGKGWFGNAILSRYPIKSTKLHKLPTQKGFEQRTCLEAKVEIDGIDYNFFITHLCYTNIPNRSGQIEYVIKLLEKTNSPKILMGDLNENPNGECLNMIPPEMINTFDVAGSGNPFTLGTHRIDYIFVDESLQKRILNCKVLHNDVTDVASDHWPVMTVLAKADVNSAVISQTETLKKNMCEYLILQEIKDDDIANYIKTLREDGTWADIQYINTGLGEIPIVHHLLRMIEMSVAYNKTQCRYYKDKQCLNAINKALNHWIGAKYSSPNWWWVKIGFPRRIGFAAMLMQNELSQEQMDGVIKILEAAGIEGTGQNKVWLAGVVCMRGMLLDKPELIETAMKAIESELRITTDEGIQPDFSFFQHGPMQQFANYGLSFLEDMPMWIYAAQGTKYEYDKSKLSILRDYILKGQQWVIWNGRYDISCVGRHLHPDSVVKKAAVLLDNCRRMQFVDPDNASSYKTILARNLNERNANDLVGNNLFWRSDYIVHRRENYFCSVKMCSNRVKGTESILEENKLGKYIADGAMYVYLSGREYENIFPVWDWYRIPGTTCARSGLSLKPTEKSSYIKSDFVGGVSDGQYGFAFMDLQRDEIKGRKTWFFFDSVIACLGAGIESLSSYPVTTSVNQCLLNGKVITGYEGKTTGISGEHSFSKPLWLHHNGIGYVFPESSNVKLSCGTQSGKWTDVIGYSSDKPVSKDVFSLFIDHGTNVKDSGYEYFILPDATAGKTSDFFKSPYVKVLANNRTLQAIQSDKDKCIQIVFYSPGTCQISENSQITTDVPCALMIRKENNKTRIIAADPTRKQQLIHLKLSQSGKEETIEIKLPQNEFEPTAASVELEYMVF
ncbi:MAG: hypothetical protein A2Y10_01045 [Planctomycetes bacterium GWF2_41_51]|nr:MAG: hypothetical protein A2Y10_01045 [Planctomycetes bacterium GWF2_41_51]